MTIRIALYQPDIPQNTGTILRLGACLGVPVDIIEPAGFPTTDRAFRRAGMDYADQAATKRHRSFEDFEVWRKAGGDHPDNYQTPRLILLSTKADLPYTDFRFEGGDILLLGRESAGVPEDVHNCADERLRIPLQPGMRSLNIAVATAMVVGEALRQIGVFASTDRTQL